VAERYRVVASTAFERDVRRVRKHRRGVYEALVRAVEILESDPFNRKGQANIRKLAGVPSGQGQFRLRVGDYRLRYDVSGEDVILHAFRPRSISYR
jgi:mRNA-degrading endonuclease RelE of RelBE toxin-antitoxin system